MFLLFSSLAPVGSAQLYDQPTLDSQHGRGKHGCFTCYPCTDTLRVAPASQWSQTFTSWPQLLPQPSSSHTPSSDAALLNRATGLRAHPPASFPHSRPPPRRSLEMTSMQSGPSLHPRLLGRGPVTPQAAQACSRCRSHCLDGMLTVTSTESPPQASPLPLSPGMFSRHLPPLLPLPLAASFVLLLAVPLPALVLSLLLLHSGVLA